MFSSLSCSSVNAPDSLRLQMSNLLAFKASSLTFTVWNTVLEWRSHRHSAALAFLAGVLSSSGGHAMPFSHYQTKMQRRVS